jgi:hypothetical protein
VPGPRLRWIAEASGVDRRTLADTVFKRLQNTPDALPQNVTKDTALDDTQKAGIKTALAAFGKPDAEVKTWGDAFEAFTGDVDGDGKTDFDVDALLQSGLAPSAMLGLSQAGTDTSLRFEETIATGDGTVTASPDGSTATLDVRLVQLTDGSFAPFTGDTPDGAAPIGQVSLGFSGNVPFLSVGNQILKATPPLTLKGLPAGTGDALVAKLLTAQAPAGTPLASYQQHLADEKAFVTGPKPKDPAEQVVWRGAKIDPATADRAVAQATTQFGIRPLKYTGYINEKSEAPIASAVLAAAQPAQGITPAFLHAIAFGEGLGFFIDSQEQSGGSVDKSPIDGFQYLGTDTFGSRVAQLKARHELPASFNEGTNYTIQKNMNEKGQTVTSATFPTLKDGLTALSSLLADERRNFLTDARAILPKDQFNKLTQDQINFFTYLYFNEGSGKGKSQLQQSGLALANAWSGPPPPNNQVSARYNALQRASTWKLIDSLGLYPKS